MNIGKAHQVDVELEYTHEFIVLENTDRETDVAVQAAIDGVGVDNTERAGTGDARARVHVDVDAPVTLLGRVVRGEDGGSLP